MARCMTDRRSPSAPHTRVFSATAFSLPGKRQAKTWVYPCMLLLVCVLLLSLRLADAQPSPPQPQASIRVVQDDGVWWFQDGTGRKFFSLGVNCVGGCYGHAEGTPMLSSRQSGLVLVVHAWG